MQNLNKDYWNNRYINNEIGWDAGRATTPLKTFIETFENRNAKILIPGCGNAHEIECLLAHNFTNITVIDISEMAVNSIKNRFNEAIENKKLNVIYGDFFEHNGLYELILEQTFFCAIHPSLREKYTIKMSEILAPNGIIAGVLFNCVFDKDGPPFGGSADEYQTLFGKYFSIKKMELCYNSIPPRSGNELFFMLFKV
jgi:methyl halide transferase